MTNDEKMKIINSKKQTKVNVPMAGHVPIPGQTVC